jgi:hypothetical protein
MDVVRIELSMCVHVDDTDGARTDKACCSKLSTEASHVSIGVCTLLFSTKEDDAHIVVVVLCHESIDDVLAVGNNGGDMSDTVSNKFSCSCDGDKNLSHH